MGGLMLVQPNANGNMKCPKCDGSGKQTQKIKASHNKSSPHSYCSHDKTTQHDN